MAYWDKLVRDVREADDQRVVISSEFFADGDDEAARRVVTDLGGPRVHVVVTLRPLAKVMPSQWQQYLQNGLRTPYLEWLDGMLRQPPYDQPTPTFWQRHRHDRLIGILKVRVVPERRRRMSRRFHENRPIAVADLKDRHLERVHPNAMHGLLIVPAAGTAHPKLSRWNQGANWFNHKRKSRPASPLGLRRD